ncbi:hypothetical protein [Mariniblastus fucicola]|nr:hypothetical protein [Mariniblastus fucicola]
MSRTKQRSPSLSRVSLQYQTLENRAMLSADGIVVADYRDDFSNAETGWSYGFNVSDRLDDQIQIASLEGSSGVLRPSNPTDDTGALMLNGTGGHPGKVSNRYAIASWTASESGVYSISDSFLGVASFGYDASDGVEVRVFVNENAALQQSVVDVDDTGFFDLTIGHLNAGDSIRVAFGSNGNHAFDRFEVDYSIRIHHDRVQSLANFRTTTDSDRSLDDHDRISQTDWRMLWNAPQGWNAEGSSGDLTTGSIDDVSSYLPLNRVDEGLLTPTGSTEFSNSPQYHLKLTSTGGHVGFGYTDSSRFNDRYVIAAHTIERSGHYSLTDSFLETSSASHDGIEIRVFVNGTDDVRASDIVLANQQRSFDVDFGNLQKGDTVYVAFGANNNHAGDRFEADFSLVRELPRAEPLRAIEAEQVLYVRDFGAIPNDRNSDVQGLTDAILEARRSELPTRIVFEDGIYNFYSTDQSSIGNPRYFFTLINQDRFEIDGQGATFVVENFDRGLFRVLDSSNVILRDFTIDYAELYRDALNPVDDLYRANTFSQGNIVSVDESSKSFVFEVDSGATIEPDDTFVSGNVDGVQAWGFLLEGDTGSRLKYNSRWHYRTTAIESLGNRRYRISVDDFTNIESGDRYVLQRRTNVGAIGVFAGAEHVSVIDVTIYSSPSAFLTAKEAAYVNVIRSNAEVLDGRWRSINADAVHGQSLRTGFWVEDSSFDAVGDDVMNFYTVPSVIVGKPVTNTITVAAVNVDVLAGVSEQLWRVGDLATFVDPTEGKTLYQSRVVAVEQIEFGHPQFGVLSTQSLTFDRPITEIRFATGPSTIDSDGFKNDTAVYNASTSQGFLVQGATLSNARRYGQFVMADDVQLVDSTYHGLTDSAIAGHNESNWPVGLYSSNVLVQNNRFLRNGFSSRYFGNDYLAGVVAFNMDRLGHEFVERDEYGLSRIEIVDNVFRGWGKTAIAARNVSGLTIENNEIFSPLGYPVSSSSGQWFAIDVQFSRDVNVLDNDLFSSVDFIREVSITEQ